MGGISPCIKYALFIFNVITFLMGCGIIGLGIWLKVEKDDYVDISSYNYITAANIIIAAGVIMLVVSFFGCLGAIKENAPLLLVYFLILLLIFIMEIAAGGYAYAKRDDIENELEKEFKNSILNEYGTAKHEGITDVIDKFQRNFDCCGYGNWTDYRFSAYGIKEQTIPKSCCIDEKDVNCGSKDAQLLDQVYFTKGCYNEVKTFLEDNFLIIGGFAIGFGVIQIFGMVFAMYLYCQFRGGSGTMA